MYDFKVTPKGGRKIAYFLAEHLNDGLILEASVDGWLDQVELNDDNRSATLWLPGKETISGKMESLDLYKKNGEIEERY